jgi:MFS family permease
MLSHAASQVGRGRAFGIHEALDQIGAIVGPLIVAGVLYARSSYKEAFLWLTIPAILCLVFLFAARVIYPTPSEFEKKDVSFRSNKMPRAFWIYLIAAALIAAGYADFPLLGYHFKKSGLTNDQWIPILYSVAMGVDAAAALFFGKMFDRKGFTVLIASTLLSAFFAPFAFLGNIHFAILGVTLWGIGMGAQESIMRAAVSGMVSADRRGSAYGLFNAVFGIAWFAGSALMGFLYDQSVLWLVIFSVFVQLISLIFLFRIKSTVTDVQ